MAAILPIAAIGGCAGAGPRYFPMSAQETRRTPDGEESRYYDTNGNGRADYAEHLAATGMTTRIAYDEDEDGRFDAPIVLDDTPPAERRHLVLVVDSVPHGVVADLWRAGRWRLFAPPSRTISPFPVMTDVSLAEFFGVSPCLGIESAFYDGQKLHGGYGNYLHERNTPWHRGVDYHMRHLGHSVAYLDPLPWFDHELGRIERAAEAFWAQADRAPRSEVGAVDRAFVGYCMGTSAGGAWLGRNGHQAALVQADRMCQGLVHRSRGRVRISALSDHGHNLVRSRRLPLPESLSAMGWRVSESLRHQDDVVLPQFGVVTCAGAYTKRAEALARDCVGIEGVEHVLWRDAERRIAIMSRAGLARVIHEGGRYGYVTETGDPLALEGIIQQLDAHQKRDPRGMAADSDWFAATVDHIYPDPLQRAWRAFHGLVKYPPDLLISVADGWHSGSTFQTNVVGELQAAHGNLGTIGSCGFAAVMGSPLPPVLRMNQIQTALNDLGFRLTIH